MFADKSVDAIWCLKGGWGSARTLEMLDFDLIKRNPKPLIGYSDITSLLNAIHLKTGLITFHGPNAIYGESDYTVEKFLGVLVEERYSNIENHYDADLTTITPGVARGKLVGGNLTVLTSVIGTPYEPDFMNGILFLEDVSEPAYKVDRMFNQLKQSGALSKLKGVVGNMC